MIDTSWHCLFSAHNHRHTCYSMDIFLFRKYRFNRREKHAKWGGEQKKRKRKGVWKGKNMVWWLWWQARWRRTFIEDSEFCLYFVPSLRKKKKEGNYLDLSLLRYETEYYRKWQKKKKTEMDSFRINFTFSHSNRSQLAKFSAI